MSDKLHCDWQPRDMAAYKALPEAFQDILKTGKTASEMQPEILFALQFYSEAEQAHIRNNIFRCLGGTPSKK